MKKERIIIKDYIYKYIKQEYLPVKLVEKITVEIFGNRLYEYRTKNNFLRCISTLYYKQVNEHYGIEGYVPTGAAYWKKVFGNDYHKKVIQPLIDLNLIQSRDFGFRNYPIKKTAKGKEVGSVGIRYRINPELTNDDEFTTIDYIRKNNSIILTAEELVGNNRTEYYYEPIPDKDLYISIDKQKAIEWIYNNAEIICKGFLNTKFIEELPNDMIIEYRYFLDGGSFNTRYITLGKAKIIAGLKNKQLFFYKDSFYIADIDAFLKYRINNLKYHYKRDVSQIGKLQLVEKRNPKTLRITNHLTNFPSKILQFINLNNQTVVQLDLRTSQFLLFANVLNIYITKGGEELLQIFRKKQTRKFIRRLIEVLEQHKNILPKVGVDIDSNNLRGYSSSDVLKFINDIFFDDFYTIIQKKFNFSERGLAKLVLFKLLFKQNTKSDVLIDKLKEHYPIVMSIIEGFKQKDVQNQLHGENSKDIDDINNFSVFLQSVESEIFIDRILYPLREKGVPCFTRHDSIVVASGYADEAEAWAKDVFKSFGFKYNHKVEEKFWDVVDMEELEDSGYFDWLTDEDLLSTDLSIEDSLEENESVVNSIYDMDEQELLTYKRLKEIGQQNDYYDLVDADFLEEISKLPMKQADKNILQDEVINLREGFTFLQDKTNEILRSFIENIDIGKPR